MAYPFGGHPTFADYQKWAMQMGCQQPNILMQQDGRFVTSVTIVAPDGRRATVFDTAATDRLTPSMVAHLDRRLGLSSPFAKVPQDRDND